MKLWDKGTITDKRIEEFTVGQDRELDLELAYWDVMGSLAHTRMLEKIGLLTAEERVKVQEGLKQVLDEIEEGSFEIEEGIEDVHSQVELLLTRRLGEVGKKIHSGRSRNDQVLLDLRLFFRAELMTLVRRIEALFQELMTQAEKHKDELMPGYTHLQVGMVSSFGLWFGAYAESLVDDLRQLKATYAIVNQNPLGSAAGYGSSFPLDRKMTTELLGFSDLAYNVVHAQLGRGKSELSLAFSLASLGSTLSKLAMDCCLYNSQNFGFLKLPDELTTGSSIMPHKKNPDVFELLRGRFNQLLSLPAQISQLTGNLPSGYHRDFQLLKEILFPALKQAADCLDMMTYAVHRMEVNTDLLDDPKYDYLYSVEEVNKLVLQGVPFRDAYKRVGTQIEAGTFNPDRNIEHAHEGSIGNLCLDEVQSKMKTVLKEFPFEKVAEAEDTLVNEGMKE
jgi:argininosuccinate lyase